MLVRKGELYQALHSQCAGESERVQGAQLSVSDRCQALQKAPAHLEHSAQSRRRETQERVRALSRDNWMIAVLQVCWPLMRPPKTYLVPLAPPWGNLEIWVSTDCEES